MKNEAHHDLPSAVLSMTASSAGISKRPSSWRRGAIDSGKGHRDPGALLTHGGCKLPLQRPRMLVLGTPIGPPEPSEGNQGQPGLLLGGTRMGLRTGPISAPQDPTLPLKPGQVHQAHDPADTLQLPGHLPFLAPSQRSRRCASCADAQAIGGDAGGDGVSVRRHPELPRGSSPARQFS